MRIPQLAIHLDRSVNDEGLKLDKQLHTAPVWSVGHPGIHVLDHVAKIAGCSATDIDGYDLRVYDTAKPASLRAASGILRFKPARQLEQHAREHRRHDQRRRWRCHPDGRSF